MSSEDTRKVRRESAGDRSIEYESSEETRKDEERAEKRASRRAGMRMKLKFTK
jgi:hypothetical protein